MSSGILSSEKFRREHVRIVWRRVVMECGGTDWLLQQARRTKFKESQLSPWVLQPPPEILEHPHYIQEMQAVQLLYQSWKRDAESTGNAHT